jgi:hypothetical protein
LSLASLVDVKPRLRSSSRTESGITLRLLRVISPRVSAIPIIGALSPARMTCPMLRQHPTWDRIRNDPRFQKLAGGG